MYKLFFALLVCFTISACGQKGPLIVDRSKVDETDYIEGIDGEDGGSNANDTATRVNRQTEGEPRVIFR